LCFGTDSLVGEGSNRVGDQVAQQSPPSPPSPPLQSPPPQSLRRQQQEALMEAHFKRLGIYDQLPVLIDPRLGRAAIVQAPAPFVYANAEAEQVARADQLLDLRGLCFGTDSLVGDGSYRVTDSTEDLLFSVEDPVGFLSSMVDRLDGPYSASEWSEDEQFDSSVEQVRSSDPPFSRSALRLCPIGGASQAAPVPRGLAWLRSAWPAIVERWLLLGPRRQGEDDFSLLSRLGYYHDDRYGEDCYGWVCSGDVGWPADHLGGRIFQPLSSSQLDAAWAHRMWRRALQSVQAILMGPSGSAWLALRSAERLRHEAFCLLLRERRISRNARSLPGMNRERHQPLANAEAAYLRAARHAEECRHRCRQTRALAAPAPSSGRRRHVRHHHLA
jgi:hypothetical protein